MKFYYETTQLGYMGNIFEDFLLYPWASNETGSQLVQIVVAVK
jgi:hypothetical protein